MWLLGAFWIVEGLVSIALQNPQWRTLIDRDSSLVQELADLAGVSRIGQGMVDGPFVSLSLSDWKGGT